MKRTASLFLVALFAGAITLGTYKLLFEKNTIAYASQEETPFIKTSTKTAPRTTLARATVDFTIAAENTVNAVVRVKNMTLKNTNPIAGFFYSFESAQ